MALELVKESWSNKINTVTIGATADEGGTRTSVVTIGGETGMPFLHFEGEMPNRPVIAMEVLDMKPEDWPEVLTEPFGDVLGDPAAWAKKCVEDYGVDMICLTLLRHDICVALSLAAPRAGNSMAARIAMIAITTSSSIRVKRTMPVSLCMASNSFLSVLPAPTTQPDREQTDEGAGGLRGGRRGVPKTARGGLEEAGGADVGARAGDG